MTPVSESGAEVSIAREDQTSRHLPRFRAFAWRVVALHMVTYFLAGIVAFFALDYRAVFESGPMSGFLRPIDSIWIPIGPSLQWVRGLLFAVVLYPIADSFLFKKNGWLILWGLFVGLAILGTCAAPGGSLEGVIYTRLSLKAHLFGLPEIMSQTLLFSLGLVAWCRRPARWMNVLGIIAVVLIVLMSGLGALAAAGLSRNP